MQISQIAGAGKDPVAHTEEDKQLKNIGAIPVVQAVKKDGDSKQSKPEAQPAPSFDHLRQEPLQLLLRAITARLTQTFGTTSAPRIFTPAGEPTLTPDMLSARVFMLLGPSFERFKPQHPDTDPELVLETFLYMANEALHQADAEARAVLHNLNVLDQPVTTVIDSAVAQIHTAFARFTG